VFTRIEKLLSSSSRARRMRLVYNHDVFDRDYAGDRTEDQ